MKVLNFDGTIYEARAGSASQPGISFAGDPNTGIYSPGADQLAISTNGTGRLFVDASGIIKANNSLRLANSGSGEAKLLYTGTSNDVFPELAGIYSDADYGVSTATALLIKTTLAGQTTPTERLRITSTGTVNIVGAGTAGSTQAVSFNGSAPVNSLVVDSSGRCGIGNNAPSTALDVTGQITTRGSIGAVNFESRDASGSVFSFYNPTGDDLRLFVNSADKVTITSGGLVGIGTTGPIGILSARAVTNGNLHIRDINTIVSGTGVALDVLNDDSTTVQDLALRGATTSFHRAGSESARIDSSGRLLVGTSSAGSSLTKTIELHGAGTGTLQPVYQVYSYPGANDANSGYFQFYKSRGGSVGANTIVASGDTLGVISWLGANGTGYDAAASISAQVDGTPGASGDMPGRLVFSTTADGASSPTPRMTITSDGAVLCGKTSTSATAVGGVFYLGRLDAARDDGDVATFKHTTAGNTVGSISITASATAYNTSSDYRLKENVTAVTDGITRLQQLKPSRFNFITDPDKTVDGFIAHEVQDIVPEAITGEKDAVDDDGNPVYQGIDQSKLVPLLTAALQEAVAKIESLEARLTAAGI